MRANRLSVVHLVLNASAGSIVYRELARCCRPRIINIKLTTCCWPIVHHECAGSLRLGITVRILLLLLRNIIKVTIRILWLLNNGTTCTIVDVKLAWLSCVDSHLEALLADGLFVVKSEIIRASGFVDHEVARASGAIVDHKLATCARSIVYCELIWSTTSIIYHELAASTWAIIDSKLIWASCSVISNKLTSTW